MYKPLELDVSSDKNPAANTHLAWHNLLHAAQMLAHATHELHDTPEHIRLTKAIDELKGFGFDNELYGTEMDWLRKRSKDNTAISAFTSDLPSTVKPLIAWKKDRVHNAMEAAIARVLARHQKVSKFGKLLGRKPMSRQEAIDYIIQTDKAQTSMPEESFEFIERCVYAGVL